MSNHNPKSNRGRKKKSIDKKELENIMFFNPTRLEIAAYFNIKYDTLRRIEDDDPEVREIMERGAEKAKLRLRRMQWQAAQDGRTPMLIWLGKQWLGQTDKQYIEQSDEGEHFTNEQLKKIAQAVLNEK